MQKTVCHLDWQLLWITFVTAAPQGPLGMSGDYFCLHLPAWTFNCPISVIGKPNGNTYRGVHVHIFKTSKDMHMDFCTTCQPWNPPSALHSAPVFCSFFCCATAASSYLLVLCHKLPIVLSSLSLSLHVTLSCSPLLISAEITEL